MRILRLRSVQVLSLGTSDTAMLRGCKSSDETSVSSDAIPIETGSPHLLVEKCG
ncbi:hypothetical protein PL9631_1100068 [Planktothrix paucivesiculata PCC 9631]|uniref:Uncharacterized protein n=1 Tax=Planktothrix paucivesiculata PCC 9631 TaxID=671071 RepID=A0A7Z9BLA7_9CYAN|nr:hypothetical protein PL9631_1100068 [Planktothrix paucivesiculata PCC 9631]